MKKWLVRLFLLIVALAVLGLVAGFFLINRLVKQAVETFGPEIAKVEVRLAGANLSIFSGRGEIKGLRVGNPAGFKTTSAIQLGAARVNLDPWSVMSKEVVIHSIEIDDPQITFEESLKGNNLKQILANIDEYNAGEKAAPSSSTRKIRVDDFVVRGGQIRLSATLLGGNALPVPLPDIHLQNLGSGGKGLTAGQLAQQIFRVLEQNTTGAVGKVVKGLGGVTGTAKKVGQGAADGAQKAVQGIEDLFKRK